MITSIAAPTLTAAWYSRYSDARADRAVRATIAVTGSMGDALYASLIRSHTNRPVARLAIALPANGAQSVTIAYDLDDGVTCHDEDGIYRAIAGEYTIVAQDTDPITANIPTQRATSDTFRIALVPPTLITALHLRGAPMRDETALSATVRGITGIAAPASIDARDAEVGTYELVFDYAARTLAWWDGPAQSIPPTGAFPVPVRLWSGTRDVYVTLAVTPDSLPNADTIGALDFTYGDMGDAGILADIDAAAADLAARLGVALEPIQAVNAIFAADYPYADDRNLPATDYRQSDMFAIRTPSIPTNRRHMRIIHAARGNVPGALVLQLRVPYIQIGGELSSYVNLLPQSFTNPSTFATFVGGTGWYAASIADYIPHFWCFALTHGLPDLCANVGQLVREYIARDAARRALIGAASVALGTYQGESFGRDGLSLSRQVASGQYGPYSAAIAFHGEWLDRTYATLRARLVGFAGSR